MTESEIGQVIAGREDEEGCQDGPAKDARFNAPEGEWMTPSQEHDNNQCNFKSPMRKKKSIFPFLARLLDNTSSCALIGVPVTWTTHPVS